MKAAKKESKESTTAEEIVVPVVDSPEQAHQRLYQVVSLELEAHHRRAPSLEWTS